MFGYANVKVTKLWFLTTVSSPFGFSHYPSLFKCGKSVYQTLEKVFVDYPALSAASGLLVQV